MRGMQRVVVRVGFVGNDLHSDVAVDAFRARSCFFFQAEDGIRDWSVTGVQTCALPISYREEWSPEELAAIGVERARRFGWDLVKFQPRASTFAEAFGSVYHPSGHRLRGPVLIKPAVADLDAWSSVQLVNRKTLDDQVQSIGMVARDLGPGVPVIQTVFSPITVGGYLVGKSQSRVVRELRKHPEIVGPAMDRIAEALIDFSMRSVAAGAAGTFYAISGS